ncbi:hypothetical protein JVU11DRAFT_1061 [Chiua virens]|nr:hypothetical protein JVU11DRAFT_1061 [Chiua virens]
MLLNIPVQLSSGGNEPTVPLAWSSDDRQLFVVSQDGNIQCFDASTGSLLSKWPIHSNCIPASIVLSNSGKFIVASADSSISFWDTATQLQLGPVVTQSGSVQSIALSSDDNWLVSGGRHSKKLVVWNLQNVLPESYRLTSASNLTVALLHLSRPVYDLWMQDQWMNAEIAITEEIGRLSSSSSSNHYALANRALIRTRLQDWNSAHNDAQQSLKVQPSVVGYIAKAMACVGKGESQAGIRTLDLAFMHHSREEGSFLLLVRSIILFETGERDDAMARVQDLIETVDDNLIFYTVQAQMLVLLGNKTMKEGDHEGAIKLFKRAQLQLSSQPNPYLKTISLIFGWQFDGLALSLRRQLCEALHGTGRMKEAAEALLETVNSLSETVGTSEETTQWIAEFTRRCVAAFESMGDAATHSEAHDEAIEKYSVALSLNPLNAQGLYLKRSKARAIEGLWEDALSDANEAITLDSASPWGYERQHAALHGLRQFDEAVNAFTSMLSAIENSFDQGVRQRRNNYVSPSLTMVAVDAAIQETFETCPLVLIDTKTGLLRDESERIRIFKADSRFKELISSMTEEVDKTRISQMVSRFFRYVMFSHTWEGKEPSFQEVNAAKSVWVLPASPLNDKLRKFCEMVRDNGYRWAWSDTCCINKASARR